MFKITSSVNNRFQKEYERFMMSNYGNDSLPFIQNKHHGIFHNYRPWEYDKIFAHGNFSKEDVVLDTGAMHTYFCLFLSSLVKQILATDNFYWAKRDYLRKDGLFLPEEWQRYVEEKGKGKITSQQADLTALPYPNDYFDKVLCISTIEHVLDDRKALKELRRVLKKGGKLLLTTEFNFFFKRPYTEEDNSYYRVYNLKGITTLIKDAGLKIRDPLIVENKRLRFMRPKKKVNAFICLEK